MKTLYIKPIYLFMVLTMMMVLHLLHVAVTILKEHQQLLNFRL